MRRIVSISMGIGFALGVAYLLVGIFRSTNSTASIGLLFLPIWGGMGAAIGGALAFVLLTILEVFSGRRRACSLQAGIAVFALLAAVGGGARWVQETNALALAKNPEAGSDVLRQVYEGRYYLRGRAVEEALAVNPSAGPLLLERFVREGKPWLVSLVGQNPGASAELLSKIVSGPPDYNRMARAAAHPNLSLASMGRLVAVRESDFPGKVEYRLYQTYVLAALARRPDLPADLFERLAAWPNPEHFLVTAVLGAPQSSCGHVAQFAGHQSEVLAHMAMRELRQRGCELPH